VTKKIFLLTVEALISLLLDVFFMETAKEIAALVKQGTVN